MAGILGPVQLAHASKEKMYVSNRIKIVRPAAVAPETAGATGTAIQPMDASAPVAAPEPSSPTSPTVASAPDGTGPDAQALDTGAGAPEMVSAVPSVQTPGQSGMAVPSDKLAAGTSDESIKTEFASLMGIKEKYYIRKGRIDPFEPFLRAPEPEVTAEAKAGLSQRVPRTPLEKIDLAQLKLTGVLRAENKTRALVQEGSGKGYIVDEGTYIGNKGGQVSKILKDRIMVSEKALDVFGKITVLERELKLQP